MDSRRRIIRRSFPLVSQTKREEGPHDCRLKLPQRLWLIDLGFLLFFSQSDLLSWQLSWNRSKLLIELTGQSPLRNGEKSAKVSKKWRPWSQGNLWTWMNNSEIYVLFGSSSMAGRMRALCLSLTSNWKTRRWDWHPGNSRQWVPALNSLVMWVNCWFSALLWDVFLPVLQCYLSIKNIS